MLGALRHAASLRFAVGASLNARCGARLRPTWTELSGVAQLSIGAHGGPPRPRSRPARPTAQVQASARAKVRHACGARGCTLRVAPRLAAARADTRLCAFCAQEAQAPVRDREKERQVYKYFDEAVITVKVRGTACGVRRARAAPAADARLPLPAQAGAGGDGEPLSNAKPKTVRNFKYQAGRQQRKFIELPVAAPADGAPGADVVLYVVRAPRPATWRGAPDPPRRAGPGVRLAAAPARQAQVVSQARARGGCGAAARGRPRACTRCAAGAYAARLLRRRQSRALTQASSPAASCAAHPGASRHGGAPPPRAHPAGRLGAPGADAARGQWRARRAGRPRSGRQRASRAAPSRGGWRGDQCAGGG